MRKITFLCSLLVPVAASQANLITFDEFGSAPSQFYLANPLRNEYAGQGVTFSGLGFNDGGAILNQTVSFGVNALSGTNFLAFNRFSGAVLKNGGNPTDPETIQFANPNSSVSIFAGSRLQGYYRMRAYASNGSLLAQDVQSAAPKTWQKLSVSANGISKVVLDEFGGASYFVYDNLSFTPLPEPMTIAALSLGVVAVIRRRRS